VVSRTRSEDARKKTRRPTARPGQPSRALPVVAAGDMAAAAVVVVVVVVVGEMMVKGDGVALADCAACRRVVQRAADGDVWCSSAWGGAKKVC
jgi:hypothetical protein